MDIFLQFNECQTYNDDYTVMDEFYQEIKQICSYLYRYFGKFLLFPTKKNLSFRICVQCGEINVDKRKWQK